MEVKRPAASTGEIVSRVELCNLRMSSSRGFVAAFSIPTLGMQAVAHIFCDDVSGFPPSKWKLRSSASTKQPGQAKTKTDSMFAWLLACFFIESRQAAGPALCARVKTLITYYFICPVAPKGCVVSLLWRRIAEIDKDALQTFPEEAPWLNVAQFYETYSSSLGSTTWQARLETHL